MAKVVFGMAISLDGYVNDRNGSVGRLYENFAEMRESQVLQDAMRETGAVMMGRRTYEMAQGDYSGYEFQVPIFVVTHDVPDVVAKGENDKLKFHFVTDGVESAIAQAKAAAGEQTVTIVGGVDTGAQCLAAGLLDEFHLTIVPVMLGGGLRLFDPFGTEALKLERLNVIASPGGRTDVQYRVVK
jgi:dihydrofolate reductase